MTNELVSDDTGRVIVLGPKDAAIVFRDDGGEEVIVPTQEDDDEVFAGSEKALRCAMILHDQEVKDKVEEVVMRMRPS